MIFSTLLFLCALLTPLLIADLRARKRGHRALWLIPPTLAGLSLVSSPSGFVASKWLGQLAMPSGLLWMALLALAVQTLRKGARRHGQWLVALWVAYSLTGNNYVGAALMNWLEVDYYDISMLSDEDPLDAVLVLGGGTNRTPWGEPQLGPTGDRLLRGARVYLRGQTRKLITSGVSVAGLETGGERSLMKETRTIWRDIGIPDADILDLARARNTKEEIAELAKRMRAEGWTRVGLITSAWHLRRAMKQAQRNQITLVPIPADIRGSLPPIQPATLIPNGFGFRTTTRACWELLGAAVGR
ncbi:MAG: YdcF family protein [Bradymonadia bacterium]